MQAFLTADQLLAHVVGDYFLQSDWMALNKRKRSLPCLIHALLYAVPFAFLTWSAAALAVIAGTHFAIDRWDLARHPIWLKNKVLGGSKPWKECSATGYDPDRPIWLAFWLKVVVDNLMHITINAAAIKWLNLCEVSVTASALIAVGIGCLLFAALVMDLSN